MHEVLSGRGEDLHQLLGPIQFQGMSLAVTGYAYAIFHSHGRGDPCNGMRPL